MSKKLRTRIAILMLTVASVTSSATPLLASTPVVLSATPTTNVSSWASDTVKSFLGSSFKTSYNYKFKCTREEFAEVLEKALVNLGYEFAEPTSNPFKDTKSKSVLKLHKAGLLAGTTGTTFGAKDTLTREQLAVIICRVYDKLGVKMPQTVPYAISDEAKVADWAKASVKRAYMADIIKGDTKTYSPKAVVSREQAIVICSRTETAIKTARETANNSVNSSTITQPSQSTVIKNNLYTYDTSTKVITVNKSCTIDASVSGTPTDFTKVIVDEGVTVAFKGIKIGEATVKSKGTLTTENCALTTVYLEDTATYKGDKSSSVTTLYTYGTATVDAKSTDIKTVNIYKATTSSKVNLKAVMDKINVDSSVNLTVSDGEVSKLTVNATKVTLTLSADTTDLIVSKGDADIDIDADKVNAVTLNAETDLTVAKGTKLKKLTVGEDGVDSKLTLKSNYDITLAINAKCLINNKTVRKTNKVTYVEGKLTIDGTTTSSGNSDEEDTVDDAESALTYALILNGNASKNDVISDLYLPTTLKGCTVTWESSNEVVISTKGKVTRIGSDSTVELRAKIKNGNATSNKVFTLTVKALPSSGGGGGNSSGGNNSNGNNSNGDSNGNNSNGNNSNGNNSNGNNSNGNNSNGDSTDNNTDNTVSPDDLLLTNLKAALTNIQTPEVVTESFRVPKVSNSYPITVVDASDYVSLDEDATDYIVKVSRSTQDVTESITLLATQGKASAESVRSFLIPKKEVQLTENDIRTKLRNDLEKLTLPTTITNVIQLSNTSANGYTVGCASNSEALTVELQGTSFVLTPVRTTVDQTVELLLSVTDGKYTESKAVRVNIPKESVTTETVTGDMILADMERILTSDLLPTTLETEISVDTLHKGQYADVADYVLTLSEESDWISTRQTDSGYILTPNNRTLGISVTETVKVTFDAFYQGKQYTRTKNVPVTILPRYTESELTDKAIDLLNARALELVELFPRTLTGTTEPITYTQDFFVEEMNLYMVVQPQLNPYASTDLDLKLRADYHLDGTFTLTPLVKDGSTVQLPVKFAVQVGGNIMHVTKTIGIKLPDASNTELWRDARVYSDIFEIINSADVQVYLAEQVPNLEVVVKDKHLQVELGRSTITDYSETSKGGTGYVGQSEVKLSKNAILGEYVYELVKDGEVVKTGDLISGTLQPLSSNTVIDFVRE